jgi:hypothetical protein
MKRFWSATGKHLWLIILVIIVFVCVIKQFPANYKLLLKPGIVMPNGGVINSEGRFHESFFMFIEKPNFREPNNKISASNPKEVNSYLEKKERYTKEYDLKLFPEIKHMETIFPVTSEGKDRILIYGRYEEYGISNLYLYDTQGKLLHKNDFHGGGGDYFVSAIFTDRLWVQISDSGNGGYLHTWEILIANDKIGTKYLGMGMEDEYHTFKIINHQTNPKMVLYRKAYVPLLNWILYFLLFEALMLVLGLFLISRKL